MGLKGSKSMFIFRSLPSDVMISPQYTTKPLGGTLVYSLRRCCVEVMADKTDKRLTRDLMLDAVPYSYEHISKPFPTGLDVQILLPTSWPHGTLDLSALE